MALSLTELEAITQDYFMLDNGKAVDIYFTDSFLLNYGLKQKKMLYKTVTGGIYIVIPLKYDGAESGFYSKGDTLSSDDRVNINAARAQLKHLYSNATIYRIDELQNAGPAEQVDMTADRIETAQQQITKDAAGSLFAAAGGASNQFTGLRALCNATTSTKYLDIAEDDLVSDDGTKPWTGRTSATATVMSLDVIRNAKRLSKVRDGAGGKIDLFVTTELLFQSISSILQVSQRFTEGVKTAQAGFTGVVFEGVEIFPDDFCPTSHGFGLNSNHVGFAVHTDGNFVRLPWMVIPDSANDRTMKILLDAELICNNRKAHYSFSALSS
jgi:hypothetical protein